MLKNGMKTISEQTYLGLKADARKLAALEAGGVDNWEGYDESMQQAGLFDDDDEPTFPAVEEAVEGIDLATEEVKQ